MLKARRLLIGCGVRERWEPSLSERAFYAALRYFITLDPKGLATVFGCL